MLGKNPAPQLKAIACPKAYRAKRNVKKDNDAT
jgi:hypothetical protein